MRYLLVTSALVLAACTPNHEERTETAGTIAAKAGLTASQVQAGGFTLQSYRRTPHKGDSVRVYLEGDGFAWRTPEMPSDDPTPINPVALRLAAADPAPDIVYFGRPCQYVMSANCRPVHWTTGRYAPDVIRAMQEAVAALPYAQIELVGYSGGGPMALFVASTDMRVRSIRSVAANLDTGAFIRWHRLAPMNVSIDSATIIPKDANIAQLHFTGNDDTVVPPGLTEAYIKSLPAGHCAAMQALPAMEHQGDWQAAWPALLMKPLPTCSR